MELVYQYLWKYRLFGRELPLEDGRRMKILHPGRLNTDAGPDFFNARLRVADRDWAGNVEIHEKASDWFRHGHDHDRAYDSVILHVVGLADRTVSTTDGRQLPTAVVTIPTDFFITYAELSADRREVRCQSRLRSLTPLEVSDWVESLAMERLHSKAGRVASLLKLFNGDWEQTLFVTLARAFGFGLNGIPFEMLAKSIPLNFMRRHIGNQFQIEALLFGQAGLLDPNLNPSDNYYQRLCREYAFLQKKYSLSPIGRELWKNCRTRPGNFPERRIALLARAMGSLRGLMAAILQCACHPDRLVALFSWSLDGYWLTHSRFGTEDFSKKSGILTRRSVYLLMINVVAPILYAYGRLHDEERMCDAAVSLLEDLPAENNSIVACWKSAGIDCRDAMRSQALIHLRREYCDAGRCLDCRFAFHLLKVSCH